MRTVLTALSITLLAGCGVDRETERAAGSETASPAAIEVAIDEAFVMVPLQGRDITMGGAEISVMGGDARLVAVEAGFADTVELHTVSMADGRMRMRQVEAYDVTPDAPLSLRRGADHLMFFGVDSLEPGREYALELVFERTDGSRFNTATQAIARSLGE